MARIPRWATVAAGRLRLRGGWRFGAPFLLVLALLATAAAKVVPAHRSNARLRTAAAEVASRAADLDQDGIVAEIQRRAIECGVTEAAALGAVRVSRTVRGGSGVCAVRLVYPRKISLYGLTTLNVGADAEVVRPFVAKAAEPAAGDAAAAEREGAHGGGGAEKGEGAE